MAYLEVDDDDDVVESIQNFSFGDIANRSRQLLSN
jgi:hypothetical protein